MSYNYNNNRYISRGSETEDLVRFLVSDSAAATESEAVPEALLIKPRSGGMAFWRVVGPYLKDGKHKVIRLKLHSKASIYVFPKSAFKKELRHLYSCSIALAKELNIIDWRKEVIEVEKKTIKYRFMYLEYETWKLIVKTKEKTYVVWPSKKVMNYVEESGTESETEDPVRF